MKVVEPVAPAVVEKKLNSKVTRFDPDAVIVAINDDDRPIKPMGSQNAFNTASEDPVIYKQRKQAQHEET